MHTAEEIKAMSTEARQEVAKEMVLTYGGTVDDPPPNPIGYYGEGQSFEKSKTPLPRLFRSDDPHVVVPHYLILPQDILGQNQIVGDNIDHDGVLQN